MEIDLVFSAGAPDVLSVLEPLILVNMQNFKNCRNVRLTALLFEVHIDKNHWKTIFSF